jgi:hypothetical protein
MSLLFLTLVGCDHTGFAFRPNPSDAPAVSDLGELMPLDVDKWNSGQGALDPMAWPESIMYAEVGASANPGTKTGATAHFKGTGGTVCLVIDPESVFWARSMASSGGGRYKYDDNYGDDGDLDMDVGLTAFYTGSPGVEMGDFKAVYTDDAGADHSLEFNECVMAGYGGATDVHAGRSSPERCALDTTQTAGVEYTIALTSFSLPLNDSRLAYAVGVFDVGDGNCDDVFKNVDAEECLFTNEAGLGAAGDEAQDQYWTGIEAAFCQGPGKVNDYCEAHLDAPNAPCNEPTVTYDPGNSNEDTGSGS